jgi:hypothetical protein
MSQRRGGTTKEIGGVQPEEIMPFSKALDGPASDGIGAMDRESTEPANSTTTNEESTASVSIDDRYLAENHLIRAKQWQESYFARGCTLSTWDAEYVQLKDNGLKGTCSKVMDGNDNVPCGCCSAILCSAMGAGRVGNFAILKQSNEWVTEEVPDEENGGTKTERSTRPRLDFIVGPVSEIIQ